MMPDHLCRFCQTELRYTFIDLGVSPLANSYLNEENLEKMEPFYPLHAYVCEQCFLVQLAQFESPQHIFSNYAYFSSYSSSWLLHAKEYTEMAVKRLKLTSDSQVIEIASNDGYLLQYFAERKIPVLGIEPAENVAQVAIQKGIPTKIDFFGIKLAQHLVGQGNQGDLIVANNVLAHVPNLHDFMAGLKMLLKPTGVITIEFPHVLQLISHNQFDTIYHEHLSYFSLLTVKNICSAHGLKVIDVEELPTHGGSLRVYVKHKDDRTSVCSNVDRLIQKEYDFGLTRLETYLLFSEKVKQIKCQILNFFIQAQLKEERIAGYGAPAKGNTLLNYCGIGKELLPYTVDKNPFKQGLYLPGTRIPIKDPAEIKRTKPNYVYILPWNLKEEIIHEYSYIREWGGKFLISIPSIQVL